MLTDANVKPSAHCNPDGQEREKGGRGVKENSVLEEADFGQSFLPPMPPALHTVRATEMWLAAERWEHQNADMLSENQVGLGFIKLICAVFDVSCDSQHSCVVENQLL